MVQTMKLELLRRFLIYLKYSSYNKAGTVLGLDPTVLSKQIHSLEDEYGLLLFEPHGPGPHHPVLTAAGEQFKFYAEQVVAQADKFEQNVVSLQKGHGYILPLGVSPGISQEFLTDYIHCYMQDVAPLRYELHELSVPRQEELLLQNQVELSFANSPLTKPHLFEKLYAEATHYHVIVAKAKPLVPLADSLELSALNDVPLCLATSSAPALLEQMRLQNISSNVVCTSLHRASALCAVKLGLGVTAFPIAKPLETAELISMPLQVESLKSENILFKVKGAALSSTAKSLVAYIQKLKL